MHAPMMMMVTRKLDAGEMTREEFALKVDQVRMMLEQSKRILLMEPATSPEGMMGKAAAAALEEMQQSAQSN